MRRPAGPAYSLLRERPGGNVVVGIAQLGLVDHVVRILVSCKNRPRLLVSRRCEDHVVEVVVKPIRLERIFVSFFIYLVLVMLPQCSALNP